jgi:hypothetical protein
MAEVVGVVPLSAPSFEFVVNWTDGTGAARTWTGGTGTRAQDLNDTYFTVNPETGAWDLTRDWSASIGSGAVTLTLKADNTDGNFDPFVNYSFNATNIGGSAVTVQTTTSAPILGGVGGPNLVRATVGYSIVDATGNGATLTPLPVVAQDGDGIAEAQIFRLSNSANATVPGVNNASWVNAGVDVGKQVTHTGAFPAGTFVDAAGFLAGPTAPGVTTWNWMQTRTRFSLTGNGDSVGITGYAEILPVPEPGEWAMMIIGLAVVGLVVSRRRVA